MLFGIQNAKRPIQLLSFVGGNLVLISPLLSRISETRNCQTFDFRDLVYLGPKTQIGKGVLVNTRAHVHHHSSFEDFTGDVVLLDANTIVTNNNSNSSKVAGVPAKPLPLKD